MNTGGKYFDVVISTPGRDMLSQYTKSLVDTIEYLKDNNISFFYSNAYSSHVAEARQRTFNYFYEKNGWDATYKKNIWIDSDISWTPDDFMALYESDKEIISGCYQFYPDAIAAHRSPDHAFTIEEVNALTEDENILYCGMGFVAINYGIIESIRHPFNQAYFFYNEHFIEDIFNEDIALFIKARRLLEKEIWLNPKVRLGHHKIQNIGWD